MLNFLKLTDERWKQLDGSYGDFQSFQWGVAGLAGFLGYTKFARFLGNLDFSLLDQVIPVDP